MLKERIMRPGSGAYETLARRYGLRLIMLYGSAARGTDTPASDADIAVLGERPVSEEAAAAIAEDIARLTNVPAVSVHGMHRVSPLFLKSVMRGIVLWSDDPLLPRKLGLYAWKLAAETKYMRDARYARVRERIAAYG